MNGVFQRQTAYKMWIKDVLLGRVIKKDTEQRTNYISFMGKQIFRINIIATVVYMLTDKEKQYAYLTIDDSSAQIRAKTWGEDIILVNKLNQGDTILLIGRIREYNGEIYITPEIIKKVDVLWDIERRMELIKIFGKLDDEQMKTIKKTDAGDEVSQSIVVEEKIQATSEFSKRKIMEIIEKLDKGDGADTNDIINGLGLEKSKTDAVIEELIKQGEIYQISPNKLKAT